MDRYGRLRVLKFSALLNSLAWFLRSIVKIVSGAVLVDTLFNYGKNLLNNAIDVVNYDLMNDGIEKTKQDEAVVVREFFMNFFLAAGYLAGVILITLIGFQGAFLIVGFALLPYLLVKRLS